MLLRPASRGGEMALGAAPAWTGWRDACQALVEASGATSAVLEWLESAESFPVATFGSLPHVGQPHPLSVAPDLPLRLSLYGAPAAAPNRLAVEMMALESACRAQLATEDEMLGLIGDVLADASRQPVFCRASGAVLGAARVEPGSALRIQSGRLSATMSCDQTALIQAVRAAMLGERRRIVMTGEAGQPMVVEVRPALRPPQALRPVAVVLAPRAEARPLPAAPLLQQAFGLTVTEAAVALDVASGSRSGDIATRRGVAISTVRAHIKAVLAKVGVNRQVELVQRLAAVA